jgi:hypothetical protein
MEKTNKAFAYRFYKPFTQQCSLKLVGKNTFLFYQKMSLYQATIIFYIIDNFLSLEAYCFFIKNEGIDIHITRRNTLRFEKTMQVL